MVSEPLIQFLFLGTSLFFIVRFVQRQSDWAEREILIDNSRIAQMIVNYKSQTGVLPTKQQLDAIIENDIREEISYREAKKMGLEKDDEIVRRRLAQKFDFVQTDMEIVKDPGENELVSFYKNNPGLFREPAKVSFTHIYFSADIVSDSVAKQRAIKVLEGLYQTKVKRAPERGDRFPLQYDYTDQSELDIRQNFGDKPMVRELFTSPVGKWTGPVQSGYGWHLIFILKRDDAVLSPFAGIKDQVKAQYIEHEKEMQNKALFDKLEKKYIIKRDYLDSK